MGNIHSQLMNDRVGTRYTILRTNAIFFLKRINSKYDYKQINTGCLPQNYFN